MISDAVNLELLELDRIQDFRHNPTVYVELIGNGLYTPFVLNYAPIEVRFQDLIHRLQRLPALVAQARSNLVDAPEAWNRVAREENDGNIELVDKTLRAQAPATLRVSLRGRRSAGAAVPEGLQQLPGDQAGGQDQRLATRQGQLRAQVPLYLAYRAHACAAARGRRNGSGRRAR